MQSILLDVAGQLALKQAGIVCAVNNDRSRRAVSLEASRHCLIHYSTRSHIGSCCRAKYKRFIQVVNTREIVLSLN